jgi:predicted solute-binding protein
VTPLRVGRVGFLNTFPVEWALSRHLDREEAVEVVGVPTALNAMLRRGEVDVANCSSVE